MFARSTGLAALLAVGAFACAPAFAQKQVSDLSEAQENEMYCVYDGIGKSDAYYEIAEAYATDDAVAMDALSEDIGVVSDACSTKYNWQGDKEILAVGIGLVGTAADAKMEELLDMGVEEAKILLIYSAMPKLTDADVDAFFDGTWATNDALKQRAAVALTSVGYPDDPKLLPTTLTVLQMGVVSLATVQDWIDYVFQ